MSDPSTDHGPSGDTVQQLMDSGRRIQRRKEEELLRLLEEPSLFEVAQALTDELLRELLYLCNFRYIIGMNGQTYEPNVISAVIERHVREKFKELTGKEYESPVVRTAKSRSDESSSLKQRESKG